MHVVLDNATVKVTTVEKVRPGTKARVFVTGLCDAEQPTIPYEADSEDSRHIWRVYRFQQVRSYRKSVTEAFSILAEGEYKDGLRYSRRAGCKCGCLPGFIADFQSDYDYFVHVKAA